jgi:hypothetical protein
MKFELICDLCRDAPDCIDATFAFPMLVVPVPRVERRFYQKPRKHVNTNFSVFLTANAKAALPPEYSRRLRSNDEEITNPNVEKCASFPLPFEIRARVALGNSGRNALVRQGQRYRNPPSRLTAAGRICF